MTTTDTAIRNYYDIIAAKELELNDKLEVTVRQKLMFAHLMITKYKDFVYKNSISDYVSHVMSLPVKHFNSDKVKMLYKGFNVVDILKQNAQSEESRKTINVYTNFRNSVANEVTLTNELQLYVDANINKRAAKYIYRKYYENVSYQLFATGQKYIFSDSRVYLKIVGKKRVGNTKTPDWGKSLKLLKLLAVTLSPSLLNEYTNKSISKVEFIDGMKEFVYDKVTNRKGIKWIVYDNKTFDHWLIINKYYCNIKGGSYLKVTPTNYIINETKSQIDFVNNAKSVDEIIYSTEVGFRDKLRALENFDMDFCLNTYTNDL